MRFGYSELESKRALCYVTNGRQAIGIKQVEKWRNFIARQPEMYRRGILADIDWKTKSWPEVAKIQTLTGHYGLVCQHVYSFSNLSSFFTSFFKYLIKFFTLSN